MHTLTNETPDAALTPSEVERTDAVGVRTTETLERPIAPRLVLVAGVVVAIVRFVFAANRQIFSLGPDEMATVGMARFLSGGEWNMLAANTYRPALSTLLAPFFAVFDDTVWLFRLGLVVNSLIAGISVWWLARIVRRLTPFGDVGVVVTSMAIALMPSSLVASAHLWAEPLVSLSFLGAMLGVLQFYDRPSARSAATPVLWTVLGFTAHGRLLPLVVLVAAIVVVGAARARHRAAALVAVLTAGVGGTASMLYTRWIVGEVWEVAGSVNTTSGVLPRLRDPLQIVDSAIGQTWYQLSASALTFGLGLVVLVRRSFLRNGSSKGTDAVLVLAMTLPLMAVSFVFMSDRARPDHVIYGRYNDAIVWPVIAVGVGWLFAERYTERRRVSAWMIGGTAVVAVELAFLLRQMHYTQLGETGVLPMISGVLPVVGRGTGIDVLLVTLVAVLAYAALIAAGSRPAWRVAPVALAGVLIAGAGVRTWWALDTSEGGWGTAQRVEEIRELDIPAGDPIGVLITPDVYGPSVTASGQVLVGLSYQWFLPEHRFVLDNGPRDSVGPYVFAVTNDQLLTRDGATIVWEDPNRPIALWLEPETLPDGDVNPAYANLTADQP